MADITKNAILQRIRAAGGRKELDAISVRNIDLLHLFWRFHNWQMIRF